MAEKECRNCFHFVKPDPPVLGENRGGCCRFPRIPLMKPDGVILWLYPEMNPDDYCGEYV